MRHKRKAEKILKLYARELMKSREADCDAFLGEDVPGYRRISTRHLLKRGLIIAAVLTLSFALIVVSANALEIKLFGFDLIQKESHTEIQNGEVQKDDLRETEFLSANYVPKGYKLVDEVPFENISLSLGYQNEQGQLLYIDQYLAGSYSGNINNEDCQIYTEIIGEMEVYIYDYDEQKTYLIRRDDIVVEVTGYLMKSEFEKIINGLSFS